MTTITTIAAPDTSTALTAPEAERLATAEQTIESGRKAFFEVGNALAAIRDGRLYRATHGTFETYCKERWDFHRAHAYRLIGAAETLQVLSPIGDTLPTTESQVRPLLQFAPEDRAEVWGDVLRRSPAEADGSRRVTAKDVEHSIINGMGMQKGEPYRKRKREIHKKQRDHRQRQEEARKHRAGVQHDAEVQEESSLEKVARLFDIAPELVLRGEAILEADADLADQCWRGKLDLDQAEAILAERKANDKTPNFPISDFINDMKTLVAEAIKIGHPAVKVAEVLRKIAADVLHGAVDQDHVA